jgi:thioredoxin reductase (NADPH)
MIDDLQNYPGVRGQISGLELGEIMKSQCTEFGTEFMSGSAQSVVKKESGYEITIDNGKTFETRAVIIASGAKPKKLCVKGEEEFSGRGVSYCATCDGNFYRGLTVMIVGGGNSAIAEALYLSKLAEKVIISYRRDSFFRAEQVLVDKVNKTPNIEIMFGTELSEILGNNFVESVVLKDGKTVKTDGVFISVGHEPDTSFLPDDLPRDNSGHLITNPDSTRIGETGIFVAGDCRSKNKKQVVIAAGLGATAAMEADEYLG